MYEYLIALFPTILNFFDEFSIWRAAFVLPNQPSNPNPQPQPQPELERK